eukprot:RCo007051
MGPPGISVGTCLSRDMLRLRRNSFRDATLLCPAQCSLMLFSLSSAVISDCSALEGAYFCSYLFFLCAFPHSFVFRTLFGLKPSPFSCFLFCVCVGVHILAAVRVPSPSVLRVPFAPG